MYLYLHIVSTMYYNIDIRCKQLNTNQYLIFLKSYLIQRNNNDDNVIKQIIANCIIYFKNILYDI